MAYKLTINAEGTIEESKVKTELLAAIESKLKELSPDAKVYIDIRKVPDSA